MGTKTCIPTSQRPIIASKFYQKATAANLLVQPNIKQGFGKKQRAAAASCQPHIGLISSNQLKSAQMETSAGTIFTDAWPPRLLFRLLHFKNSPLLLPQCNRTGKLFEVKASWTTLSPACSPHARNDYRET